MTKADYFLTCLRQKIRILTFPAKADQSGSTGYQKIYNAEPYLWANFKSIFQKSGYFDRLASRNDKNYTLSFL